ncbi:MAG TPA: ABC transporter permease [Vicinamibacterales bacterium]
MRRSLRSWLWRVPLDQEVDEEIGFHVEMRTRELVERGADPKEARAIVLARVGDVGRLKRTCVDLGKRRDRQMRVTRWLGELRDDVAYALRQLRAAPGFTAVSVITLALGIGANSAMFALADATLLRPLPFPEPERLVMLSESRANGNRIRVNPLDFEDWEARTRAFTAIAAVISSPSSIIGDDGVAEEIPAQAVTARFFDVLGVKPLAGRSFVESDEGPANAVVMMSETLWRRRFGADPALIGHTTRLGGRVVTVIGIMPADFNFDLPGAPGAARGVWTLLNPPTSRAPSQRYAHYLQVIGRLKPGVALEAGRADIAAVADALARESPDTNTGHTATADPLRERLIAGELRLTAMLLVGVVGLVLLMCCANVANLLLARASARAREFAVRAALGAGRGRIVRQLLTESLVLATFGGVVGAAIGAAILRAAPALIPRGLLPASLTLHFDGRALLFCLGASSLVAILYGLAPAWHATNASPIQAMTAEGRTTTSSGSRFRRLLATTQVAVAVLLLCGAGLLLRTLLILERVDPGTRSNDLLTMVVGGGSPATRNTPEGMLRNYESFENAVENVPGVRAIAWGSSLPFDGAWYFQEFQIEGDSPRPQGDRENTGYFIVSPSYFRLLGLPLLTGRMLADSDTAGSPQVCLVDEEFVRRHLSGRDPLGTRIAINAMEQPPRVVTREIVGVVRHVKGRPDETEAVPQVYVPLAQNPWWDATLMVQPAAGKAEALAPAVRGALATVDRERPARLVRTLSAIGDEATARPRFRTVLIGTFALLALVLAMVGVFGVLAYSVQQRTREFGLRIALGATTRSVLGLVVSSATPVIAIGTLVGLVGAAALTRTIASFLFGVQPLDPLTFAIVPLVLAITAAVAMASPALRAARVDPVDAFRAD